MTTTNAAGVYSLTALPVGTYNVTASAFGFATETGASATVTEGSHDDAELRTRCQRRRTRSPATSATAPAIRLPARR